MARNCEARMSVVPWMRCVLQLVLCCVASRAAVYLPLQAHVENERGFISYTAVLGIGSPPQWHSLVVDTGSAALAVSGVDCFDTGTKVPCVRPTAYDPG